MPSTSSSEELNIFSHLQSKHNGVSVSKTWISEQLRNGISNAEQIYKTWLITDITDTHPDPLPPETINMEIPKCKLEGPFTLQLISVMDVGSSCYSQLKKLSGKSIPQSTQNNTQYNEPPPSRMMFLTLTDGTNVITAMEYKPCSQLSVNLLPGSKIVVSNVTLRIGMLLLEPGSFRILGGCVESLRAQYTQEQVLKFALEGEDSAEDEEDNKSHLTLQDIEPISGQNALRGHTTNLNIQSSENHNNKIKEQTQINPNNSNHLSMDSKDNNGNSLNCVPTSVFSDQTNSRQSIHQPESVFCDVSNQRSFKALPSKGILTKGSSEKPTEKCEYTKPESSTSYESKNAGSKDNVSVPAVDFPTNTEPLSGFVDSLTAEFFEPMDESDLEVNNHMSIPIKTLCINLNFPVKVTASISSLCSKLTPVPEWTVQARLTDFSGSIECRLSESLLANMIGYTSKNFTELKPVSATNPSVKTFLRQGLESCQKQLTFLTGIFTIRPNTVKDIFCQFEVIALDKMEINQENGLRDYVMAKCNAP